jgi:hypothetical protein
MYECMYGWMNGWMDGWIVRPDKKHFFFSLLFLTNQLTMVVVSYVLASYPHVSTYLVEIKNYLAFLPAYILITCIPT